MTKPSSSFIQKRLEWIYEQFSIDTSKMLIVTGALGWMLSCLAQAGAVIVNPKVSTEKKSFLLPQELMDGTVNVISFLAITILAKKSIEKVISTGKFLPESVRKFVNKNSIYKNKVGKLDFNLDDVLKESKEGLKVKDSYDSYKNFTTTMGTLGASIVASNIVTPLIRNKTASKVHNTYIDMKTNPTAYVSPNSDLKV